MIHYLHALLKARTTYLRGLAAALALGTGFVAGASATTTTAEGPYPWSAELVAIDEDNATATVRARVAGHAVIDDLSAFSAGDPVTLTWSGVFTASGVRDVTERGATDASRFAMPVEFVSSDHDGRYVTFRVPVPAADLPDIAALEAGDWITAYTPHGATDVDAAIVSMRAYNDVD